MTAISRAGILVLGVTTVLCMSSMAQYGGGSSSGAGATAGSSGAYNLHNNSHVGFDRPEAWGLKYFASLSLLSGLPVPEGPEGHKTGAVTVGFEADWLPELDEGQRRIGFGGTTPEDLNKAPIFARVVVRVGLPGKFTAIAAAPPPFEVFGIKSRLLAFGLERPLVERDRWTFTWRGYGQVGHVEGAFTCSKDTLQYAPGSPENLGECLGESADTASLRYAGSEFQFAYRMANRKLVPYVAVGGNFIDGVFNVHAPVQAGLDQTRLWTRGGTFSTSGGVTYLFSKKTAFTVDAFYSPLWVQRTVGGPTQNDGLFNVRAMVSYSFR